MQYMNTFDRYEALRGDGTIGIVPHIKLDKKRSDYFEQYISGKTRLDILSNNYYGNANYDWLILAANPELPSMEHEIPNGSIIRIPYPLETTLTEYMTKMARAINNK